MKTASREYGSLTDRQDAMKKRWLVRRWDNRRKSRGLQVRVTQGRPSMMRPQSKKKTNVGFSP